VIDHISKRPPSLNVKHFIVSGDDIDGGDEEQFIFAEEEFVDENAGGDLNEMSTADEDIVSYITTCLPTYFL
jgi:hypothetical protein